MNNNNKRKLMMKGYEKCIKLLTLSTRAARISRFHFPAKVAKKVGPGGTQDWGGLRTHGDSGPETRDRGGRVVNNTLTL